MTEMTPLPSISSLKTTVDQTLALKADLEKRISRLIVEIEGLEADSVLIAQTGELFRQLIDLEIMEGVRAVESLLSEGLSTVFDDQTLSVTSEVSVSRGKVSVELITEHTKDDGTVIKGSSSDSFGGAVSTVQSILMRMIVLLRREMRPLLLLDESLPAFDENYVHNMGKFLSLMCKRLDMDVLLVTHNPSLVEAADSAYRIQKRGGEAHFIREK